MFNLSGAERFSHADPSDFSAIGPGASVAGVEQRDWKAQPCAVKPPDGVGTQMAMASASDTLTLARDDEVDRNLALLSYGLMFFAIFFAGVPALIAVAIAYARLRDTDCGVKSHFRFQTFIFWVGFALTLSAALAGLAALALLAGEIIRGVADGRWDTVAFSQVHVAAVLTLTGAAGVLAVLTGVWLMATSAYGFILLASRQSIRQTAR
jgi:uncharacterized membrane protein